MSIAELLEELGKVKVANAELYKSYKENRAIEDQLKEQLNFMMHDLGSKSFKGEHYLASITETPTIVITNETAAMEWLQNTPDVEADFYIGIKKPEFNTLAKQMLKQTGELADGTELEVRESLTIKKNKEK